MENEEYEDDAPMLEQLIEQQEQELLQVKSMQEKKDVEERILKNKLKKIFRDIGLTRTKLKPNEQKIVKQAKQHKKLKKDVKNIETALMGNKLRNFSKFMSASPALVTIFMYGLFIFLLIAVVASLGSIMPWLFGGGDNDQSGNAAFGVTGDDFYGIRMVYQDDEKANKQIVEDYVNFVENGILKFEETTSVDLNGDGTADYYLTIESNINVPGEDYDYSNFNESDFISDYPELNNLTLKIAKETFKADNNDEEYLDSSLVECVQGIKYFGIGNINNVADLISQEIVNPALIVVKDGSGTEITDASTLATILPTIETTIETNVSDYYKATYTQRTEKLFVKDYILENADSMVSGVTNEKYVQMIFMPKKNVTFTSLSFAVGNAKLNDFSIKIGDKELTHDGNNLGNEEKQSYIYSSGSINISVEQFQDINEDDLSALSEGLSLFEISKLVNYDKYLTANTETGILELNQNGVIVEMNNDNDEKYMVLEYESKWTVNN